MICEGSGFPEGDSANAPDFITGRFHDRTYAKIIIIFENDIVSRASRWGGVRGPVAVCLCRRGCAGAVREDRLPPLPEGPGVGSLLIFWQATRKIGRFCR